MEWIDSLDEAATRALVEELTVWASGDRFVYEHVWRPHDIVMWDNTWTQHYVVNDFVGERTSERVTVMGDRVEGAAPRWRLYTEIARPLAMGRHDRQLRRHPAGRARAAE